MLVQEPRGELVTEGETKWSVYPAGSKNTPMESQTPTLVWSSHLKNSDLNSIPVPFRCLLFPMACYLWLRFPYQPLPLFCQPGTAPLSNVTHTSPSPVPPNFCQRSAGCPGIATESQACSGLSCVPLSLSPSGCAHWSISISHGAFSARPAGSSQQRAWEGGGKPPWDSVTAAGLGSQSVTIKSDPQCIIQHSAFPKRSLILVSLYFSFSKSRLMLIPGIKPL